MRQLGRQGGENYTPAVLRQLLTEITCREISGPTLNVLDPAVGTGGLLAEVANRYPDSRVELYGTDVGEHAVDWAEARLSARSGSSCDIELGDALHDDPFPDLQADLVLIDPPYGLTASDRDLDRRLAIEMAGAAPRNLDLVWTLYAANHLKPGGRAGVVLPAGILFRGGAEGDLRREILRRGIVETVIALPGGLAAATGIPLCILLLRATGSRTRHQDVLLIDATGPRWDWHGAAPKAIAEVSDLIQRAETDQVVPARYADNAAVLPVLDLLAPDVPLTPAYWVSSSDQH